MLVGELMSRNPVTIRENESLDNGLQLMRERKVRRLPVLDGSGRMVGIVSDKDLLHAAPSPVTSLSVYELHYLLARLKIKQLMSSPVITVTPDTPIEQAARIMADKKIGGLPVVEAGSLVGIITETDILKILVELLGARAPGLRLTVMVKNAKGVLARLTGSIAEAGGNIISVVTYGCEAEGECRLTLKIGDLEEARLRGILRDLGIRVLDLRSA